MARAKDRATAALCARIGATYLGPYRDGDDWSVRMRSYGLTGDAGRAARGRIDHLRIIRSGNFGNNLVQVIHALILVEAHGIRRIVHDVDWLADTAARPRLTRAGSEPSAEAGLMGTFFLANANRTLGAAPPERALRMIRDHLKPAFTLTPAGAGGLCLNLRGGADVFENPSPNGRYGQPPLSYYQMAARHILTRHGDMPVEIVHQDHRNPVLAPLVAWAEAEGLSPMLTSGGPEADARAILSARHLVMGWTRFTAGLALLSSRLESLTIFRTVQSQDLLCRAIPALNLIEDAASGYTPPRRWRNDAAQRAMMIEYPGSNLVMRDIAVIADHAAEVKAGARIRRAARWQAILTRAGFSRI